jgi:hypothetical protein
LGDVRLIEFEGRIAVDVSPRSMIRRERHLDARYSFGIRSVLLIMSVPDRTNIKASGCKSHGPIGHAPP